MRRQWRKILSQFLIEGLPVEVSSIGNGLINDTYKVRTVEEEFPDYVLQRINHNIFTDVALMQDNIERVTNHIRHKLAQRGEKDLDRKVLRFIPTKSGKTFCKVDDEYWRVSIFIDNSKSFEEVTPELAYLTGKSFGDFQFMLSDLAGEPLGATIPNFHNIEFRLQQLDNAINDDKAGRVKTMQPVIEQIMLRAKDMSLAEDLARKGLLPRRITHCDTKVNNMLFDNDGNFLCVIDLDTTMPGYVLSDFGDFIRTAGNNGAEDDKDLAKVSLNMEIFHSFTKGYLEGAKPFLTSVEMELLPFGAKLMTYMQAVRFLTDYLNGDTYYKIKYPEHNYDRTMAQLTLLKSIEGYESEMNVFIKSLL